MPINLRLHDVDTSRPLRDYCRDLCRDLKKPLGPYAVPVGISNARPGVARQDRHAEAELLAPGGGLSTLVRTEHHVTGRTSTTNASAIMDDASGHKALLVRMYVLPHHSLSTAR
eukprot:COSAG04_NODE_359_length_16002_cov_57.430422_8_plen_114_part_00